jgi:hypothetical protein
LNFSAGWESGGAASSAKSQNAALERSVVLQQRQAETACKIALVQPNIDVSISIHAGKLAYLAVENEVSEFFQICQSQKILISKMGN